ncbi:Septin-like protein [Zancudomyces culisetae]|uniref:Septin-like protein n=1 Tax=Zancudomyces culisetae TaxID=1213189 RepID=A0A1R1PWT1_ZANCU|nr:Septin-like protein [Zancudomyces culisetae]|eukprot:OMH85399.1 Septin-like protein [Zancudomyces culisetae]
MLVGVSGLGRRTFVNTLCEREVIPPPVAEDPEMAHMVEPMKFNKYETQMIEDGTNIFLTTVDTPGYGDGIDNYSCFTQLQEYIESQFDEVLLEESRIRRNSKYKDNRVHVLLYFLTPTGHGLRELDIEAIKRLGHFVNIILLIGRADTFTTDEIALFKLQVMKDVMTYELPIYNFGWDDESDPETLEENQEIQAIVPFSIVGCDEVVDGDYGSIRVRRYPWGTVEIDNDDMSDFGLLRYILLNSHISDFIDYTNNVLYEEYRTQKLNENKDDESEEEKEEDDEE